MRSVGSQPKADAPNNRRTGVPLAQNPAVPTNNKAHRILVGFVYFGYRTRPAAFATYELGVQGVAGFPKGSRLCKKSVFCIFIVEIKLESKLCSKEIEFLHTLDPPGMSDARSAERMLLIVSQKYALLERTTNCHSPERKH